MNQHDGRSFTGQRKGGLEGRDDKPTLVKKMLSSTAAGMAAAIVVLHLAGIVLMTVASLGDARTGAADTSVVALAVTAYLLGMRHAFDADHIAAIDTTTRKLVNEGSRPISVGFWFSLGHSTVVFGLCALLAFGARILNVQVVNESSRLQEVAAVVGGTVAGVFLLTMAGINLVTLRQTSKVLRQRKVDARAGICIANIDDGPSQRGLTGRLLQSVSNVVSRPRGIYPIGVLFGLGFDTATEIALLILAGSTAVVTTSWTVVLALPFLFAAGMCLLDTINGLAMQRVYGWALQHPLRKLHYNMTITAVSVAVALTIGTAQMLDVVRKLSGSGGGIFRWFGALSVAGVGYGMTAFFVVCWAASRAHHWKLARSDVRTRARTSRAASS